MPERPAWFEMRRCQRCGRRFESPKALKTHLRDKHYGYYFARFTAPWLALLTVVVLGAFAALPYLAAPGQAQEPTIDKEALLNKYLTGHEKLAMHIHAKLKILVDGVEVKVPANIGILPDGRMRVIHTHDETGVIHIESPKPAEFTLGDFLKIWGKNLTSECFDKYCGKVRVAANGVELEDPLNYVLRDGDELAIEITTE